MQLGQLIKRIIKLRIKKIFIWLEFNIEIHGMTGKQCEFSAKKAGKDHFLMKFGWNIKILYQWTPCYVLKEVKG